MSDTPIFVDRSGRRRRLFTAIAAAAGVLAVTAAAILVAGFVGPGPGHLPGLPDLQPAQREVARVPPPQPAPAATSAAPPRRPANTASPAPSISDIRGNGGGNANSGNRPSHPRPTRSK